MPMTNDTDRSETEGGPSSALTVTSPEMRAAREQIEPPLESEELQEAVEMLERLAEQSDASRSIEDNLWLYRTLGRLRMQRDQLEAALEAYRHAFELDPRDEDVLERLGRLLIEEELDPPGESDIWESLLVHGREVWDDSQFADVHRRLGEVYQREDQPSRGYASLQRAVEALDSDREALETRLEALHASGEPFDELEARRTLIAHLDEPEDRARAYMALGDKWRDRGDEEAARRALEMYERASEAVDREDVWRRLRSMARELEDSERHYESALRLVEHLEDRDARIETFLEAAQIARDQLGSPERALRSFEHALDEDPSQFDVFQSLASILESAERWERLESAYRQMIAWNRDRDETADDLRAILWYQLGDLYREHLDRPDDAIEAYREASELFPDNPEFHEAIVDTAESEAIDLEVAEPHLRALYRIDPDRIEVLERLGRLYLHREEVDAALVHLRAFRASGGTLDDQAASFLEQFETGMYHSPERELDPSLLREELYPEELDLHLNEVFRLIYPVLHDWTSEFRTEYGLERGDFIEPDTPLAFNNIYRDVADHLGYDPAPDLWQSSDYQGLTKAALDEPAVIVGDDLAGGSDERRLAFAAAKTLFLLERPFYGIGVRDRSDLQAFFLLALQLVRPDVEFERGEAMEEAYGAMERAITGDDRERLREAIDAATDDSDEVDLGTWFEAVEDTANRVGLVFAGDLGVAREHLRAEESWSERSVEARMQALTTYSLSEAYRTLRERLGMAASS